MKKIDPAEYRKRLDALSQILNGIAEHANDLAQTRCPYKNRRDECTAQFGCRNKRKPADAARLPHCAGDDKLDYRPAWDVQ